MEKARRPNVLRATVSWNHQRVTVGRSKALAALDVRCTRAVVYQVPGSLILQTPVNCNSETGGKNSIYFYTLFVLPTEHFV